MSLLKPTTKSRFHIDFAWWEKNDRDWRVFLQSLLCAEHQITLADMAPDAQIDWIDPNTAEVRQVDGIRHVLMTHCASSARLPGRAHDRRRSGVSLDAGERQQADERRWNFPRS